MKLEKVSDICFKMRGREHVYTNYNNFVLVGNSLVPKTELMEFVQMIEYCSCPHEFESVGGSSSPHGNIEPEKVCRICGGIDG